MPRSYTIEFDSYVNGGLPITVKARMHPPEPDIGINYWQPEPALYWRSGKPLSDNVRVSEKDWDRIMRECMEYRE